MVLIRKDIGEAGAKGRLLNGEAWRLGKGFEV